VCVYVCVCARVQVCMAWVRSGAGALHERLCAGRSARTLAATLHSLPPQHSTAQHSTAQHSAAQRSAAQSMQHDYTAQDTLASLR
jgi:hypothetical protein